MFIGIDQSFTETAITILFSPHNYTVSTIKGKGRDTTQKLTQIYKKVFALIRDAKLVYTEKMGHNEKNILCFIEAGSFGSQGRLFTLGQLSGVILSCLISAGITYKEIAPTTLKKFITGNGSSDKKYIMRKIREKYNIDFKNDNKADSYVLALMAYNFANDDKVLTEFREEHEVIHNLKTPKNKKRKVHYRRRRLEF